MKVENKIDLCVNMAMTLDGKVQRPDGRWYGLTSVNDRERMDVYRMQAEGLIIGKNSILMDNPVSLPRNAGAKPPVPIVICRNTLVAFNCRVFEQQAVQPLLFVSRDLWERTEKEGRPELVQFRQRVNVVALERGELEPASLLERLYGMGFRKVLLEGGPTLNHSFFGADLVDTLYVTIVPYLIGGNRLPGIVDGEAVFPGFEQAKWGLVKSEAIGDELLLQYRRKR